MNKKTGKRIAQNDAALGLYGDVITSRQKGKRRSLYNGCCGYCHLYGNNAREMSSNNCSTSMYPDDSSLPSCLVSSVSAITKDSDATLPLQSVTTLQHLKDNEFLCHSPLSKIYSVQHTLQRSRLVTCSVCLSFSCFCCAYNKNPELPDIMTPPLQTTAHNANRCPTVCERVKDVYTPNVHYIEYQKYNSHCSNIGSSYQRKRLKHTPISVPSTSNVVTQTNIHTTGRNHKLYEPGNAVCTTPARPITYRSDDSSRDNTISSYQTHPPQRSTTSVPLPSHVVTIGIPSSYDPCTTSKHMEAPPSTADSIDISTVTVQRVPEQYMDIGDCNEQCVYCGAAFWYGERIKDKKKNCRPMYHGCCAGGKVKLQAEIDPPYYITELLRERQFLENIRAYNQMFAMTSFGAKIDDNINNIRGPYVFKLSGQVYHWIGSLCPTNNDHPRFLQLYIHDTQHEVDNRLRHFKSATGDSALDATIVEGLIATFDEHNDLIKLFRTARDKCMESTIPNFKIRLYSLAGIRGYELPSSDAVGAIVIDSGFGTCTDYDVVIELKTNIPQRINKLHPCYMSLQFPLLFIYGQQGYHLGLKRKKTPTSTEMKRMSMNAFYTYQLHERHSQYNLMFRCGRLFQQYVVSVYCCIEQNRMDFLRANQKDIRREYLSGVYDAISKGDREGSDIGTRVILPSSFTGEPRYMYSHYLDALAICRILGNPQFFTFTCNIQWPEIKRHLSRYPNLLPNDGADIISRVFEQKVQQLMKHLRRNKTFGTVAGG